MPGKRLALTVSEDELDRLTSAAQRSDVELREWVRNAVLAALESDEEFFGLAVSEVARGRASYLRHVQQGIARGTLAGLTSMRVPRVR